jgi:hypothetical protein
MGILEDIFKDMAEDPECKLEIGKDIDLLMDLDEEHWIGSTGKIYHKKGLE